MSQDGMFGPLLRKTRITNSRGNPWVAVVVTWVIVQLVLLIGKVNAIAPIVTIFFLLAYTACDLACLGPGLKILGQTIRPGRAILISIYHRTGRAVPVSDFLEAASV